MKKQVSFLLVLALLLTSCGGGSGASAAAMHLRRAVGTVGVADGEGKTIEPRENLGLYSGYGVDTRAESYAWIDLDEVKLTKLDQNSEIEITREDKKLEIEVKSGSLFFNVTEPLADDETMNIRTSTMMVGIRGTCGWVSLSEDKGTLTVGLLEGKVECSNGENTAAVSAGEKGIIPASGEITVVPLAAVSVPAFVKAELEEDSALAETVKADSGLDVLAPIDPMRLRDMYTYSRSMSYNAAGELNAVTEYFPDEQGRIGSSVSNHNTNNGTTFVYNDAGTLSQSIINRSNNSGGDYTTIYTTVEDTADHRKMVNADDVQTYSIHYYDEQGHETKVQQYWDDGPSWYRLHTYDAEGKRIRSDNYLSDGSPNGYILYEYD